MIKEGTVVFLKTTEEPCFVLAIVGREATVRRPTMKDTEGIQHHVETFLLEEFETGEERHARQFADMQSLKDQFASTKNKTISELVSDSN